MVRLSLKGEKQPQGQATLSRMHGLPALCYTRLPNNSNASHFHRQALSAPCSVPIIMDTFFAPTSLAVYGLSSKARNTPRIIVDNCLRWGFRGRLFGINPATTETEVGGVRVYRRATDLPITPDLAVLLIPGPLRSGSG